MSYNYSDKLRDPRWQKIRLEVFNRAGWACQCCGNKEDTLCVHHLIYSKGEPWDSPINTLECLCEDCHEWREDFNSYWGRSTINTTTCWLFTIYFRAAFNHKKNGSTLKDQFVPKVHGFLSQWKRICYDRIPEDYQI